MSAWLSIPAELVSQLPAEQSACWPREFRPAASPEASAGDQEARAALADWVAVAAAMFASAQTHVLVRISCDELRLVAQAAVVGHTATVLLRHGTVDTADTVGTVDAVAAECGLLYGACVSVPELPRLLATLVPGATPRCPGVGSASRMPRRTVTGIVLPSAATAPSAAYATAPLIFHDCPGCPHPELVGADIAAGVHFPGPQLGEAVRTALIGELIRAQVWSCPP